MTRAFAPGEALPLRRYPVTQALVDLYAEASGDHNPLHIDAAFAAGTFYGRTIAHGLLTLALIGDAMTHAWGARWLQGGELDVAFLAPVFPGDTVEIAAVVDSVDEERLTATIECRAGGRLVVAGTASLSTQDTTSKDN